MIDGDEADDKIIAVLESDVSYGHIENIADAPPGLIDRLKHYFLTYKQLPEEQNRRVEVAEVYDRAGASAVILRSIEDYRATYGAPETRIEELRRSLRSARCVRPRWSGPRVGLLRSGAALCLSLRDRYNF